MKNYRSFINSLPIMEWPDEVDDTAVDEFETDYYKLKKQLSQDELLELSLVILT